MQTLIQENENKDSIFYHKIDLDNIGIGGHSQGGPAVFNMVTNQEHGDMIKALYAASATSSYHTAVYGDGWEYDISKAFFGTSVPKAKRKSNRRKMISCYKR